jgi:hypothetical protein
MKNFIPVSVIKPGKDTGHEATVLDRQELLEDWIQGIDFSGLSGQKVVIEDTVVNSAAQFREEYERLAGDGNLAREQIDVRFMRPMVGG